MWAVTCGQPCRLYQTHLKDSHEKVRSKAAAVKQAANQPSKAGSGREAGLRAAMMAPLAPNVGPLASQAGSTVELITMCVITFLYHHTPSTAYSVQGLKQCSVCMTLTSVRAMLSMMHYFKATVCPSVESTCSDMHLHMYSDWDPFPPKCPHLRNN